MLAGSEQDSRCQIRTIDLSNGRSSRTTAQAGFWRSGAEQGREAIKGSAQPVIRMCTRATGIALRAVVVYHTFAEDWRTLERLQVQGYPRAPNDDANPHSLIWLAGARCLFAWQVERLLAELSKAQNFCLSPSGRHGNNATTAPSMDEPTRSAHLP
jgi:hypothetical protein